jgi:hypothetical protein
MLVAYIAGPYRAPTESEVDDNIDRAKKVAKEVAKLGVFPICPHLNTAHFGGIADDSLWLNGDLIMLENCADCVVLVDGWQLSKGTALEIERASAMGIPVYGSANALQFDLDHGYFKNNRRVPRTHSR